MILAALNDLYDRLLSQGEVSRLGYSMESISYALVYSLQGQPVRLIDLRDHTGSKPRPKRLRVPKDPNITRTSGIQSHPLWDKTSYTFGMTGEIDKITDPRKREKKEKRLPQEHEAFLTLQQEMLSESDDPTIQAFLKTLGNLSPERVMTLPGYSEEVLDSNIVFLPDDGDLSLLHERESAQLLWHAMLQGNADTSVLLPSQCAVSGAIVRPARIHPSIKGVKGGKASGNALVSFNESAYLSHGQSNATTAPVSADIAAGYTTALNHLLRYGSHQRMQLGDATVVFWAQAATAEQAHLAEDFFAAVNDPPSDEQEAERLRILFGDVLKGRPLTSLDAGLAADTRFFILGLAPNAARLSVRFWYEGTLEQILERYARHFEDIALEPSPWRGAGPSTWKLIEAVTPMYKGKPKADRLPPRLAAEMTQAILTGRRYPRSLLSSIVMRFRADGHVTGARVALCKAVLAREFRLSGRSITSEQEIPVTPKNNSTNPGYLLGRLFAVLENIQYAALGRKIGAPISDRFYGSASATPANVFAILLRNARHHLAKMRKNDKVGLAHSLEGKMADLLVKIGDHLPRHLSLEDQGRFAIGYYHESAPRLSGKGKGSTEATDTDDNADTEGANA